MKASISWLQDYVAIQREVAQLADALTMVGLEVETIGDRWTYLESVRVGRIERIAPHPEASQLQICQVQMRDELRQVVCGAPNVAAGMRVPMALPGTVLPNGSRLSVSAIRGQRSEGMLCSEAELGLGSRNEGVLELAPHLEVGQGLAKALNLCDPVLEIGLTPNRSDCLCMLGIAREIAAIEQTRLRYPVIELTEIDPPAASLARIEILDPDLCPRYAARVIADIRVGPSPEWLRQRLLSVGQRPINNMVDITNFVMLEYGQPLHAFDLDWLAEQRIVVRGARAGERMTTLDGRERELAENMLLICDGRSPVAIAGVMGGLDSEITAKTRRVLLESARFNPASVRRTARTLGLPTEASHRFERGIDPAGSVTAANRAAALMALYGGGQVLSGAIDVHPRPEPAGPIVLDVGRANRLLGADLPAAEMATRLRSIEFQVQESAQQLSVIAPSCRVDIARPEDLVEEIARLWGYNRIPTTFPALPATAPLPSRHIALRRRLHQLMRGFGFHETVCYSFIAQDAGERLRLADNDRRRQAVAIRNPLSEEQAVMRTSLLPGLLTTLGQNFDQGLRTVRFYEIGRTYLPNGQELLPEETEMLAALWSGQRQEASWHTPGEPCDFYDLKGVLEALLSSLGIAGVSFTRAQAAACPYLRAGYAARIASGERTLGWIGEVHAEVRRRFDLKPTAFFWELDVAGLERLWPERRADIQLSKFPAVSRDLTLIVERTLEAGEVIASLAEAAVAWLEGVQLVAIYEGPPVPAGHKSISLRMTYRSAEQTLADEMVNAVHRELSERLLRQFRASLPG